LLRGDAFYDIAVLEFVDTPGSEIKALAFRKQSPRIGEPVFAIGNPLGKYPYSISNGIISGKNRFLGGMTGRYGYLQTTAGLIWGNSGGPLIAEDGRVVGVNTRIEITEGMGQALVVSQINFALDGAIAAKAVSQLLSPEGRIPRAFLGVELGQDTRVVYDRGGNPVSYHMAKNILLTDILAGSPADRQLRQHAGRPVLRINDREIDGMEAAITALEEAAPGKPVRFVLGGMQETTVDIPTERLDDQAYAAIARFYVHKYFDRDLVEDHGQVRAVKPAQRMNRVVNVRVYDFNPGGETVLLNEKSSPAEFSIFAAGGEVTTLDDLWYIRSSADLGRSIRLGAIAGGVALAIEEELVGRCLVGIQCPDNNGIRTLLYY
ncbi:MAG: serine protease, partial [Bacteroidetes bacterium]|nr:serine protease [Bacteroidota bacterium]